MKWFFALLVLANVAFFMWTRWHGESQDGGREARPEVNAQNFRLLSEPGAARTPRKVTAMRSQCDRLGPLTEADRAKAVAVLEQLTLPFKAREEAVQTPAGFLVFIPPLANERRAQAKLRELRRKGVKDFALLSDAAKRNAISLGLFTTTELAARYAADLAKKGVVAQIEPQTREEKRVWIEAEATVPSEARQRLASELGADRVHSAPCPAPDIAPRP